MGFSLVQVNDHLSLELDTADAEHLSSHIKARFVDFSSQSAGLATIVRFGGQEFTFQSFWDDPCLISRSKEGDDLLRQLFADLESQKDPRSA